jgi:hypothetical protein
MPLFSAKCLSQCSKVLLSYFLNHASHYALELIMTSTQKVWAKILGVNICEAQY